MKKITITPEFAISISKCLYSNADSVTLEGIRFPVINHRGLRAIDVGDIRFVQHDTSREGGHSQRVKAGHMVTWGMRKNDRWIFVDNDNVKMESGITVNIP